jgi:hypothetical protein
VEEVLIRKRVSWPLLAHYSLASKCSLKGFVPGYPRVLGLLTTARPALAGSPIFHLRYLKQPVLLCSRPISTLTLATKLCGLSGPCVEEEGWGERKGEREGGGRRNRRAKVASLKKKKHVKYRKNILCSCVVFNNNSFGSFGFLSRQSYN